MIPWWLNPWAEVRRLRVKNALISATWADDLKALMAIHRRRSAATAKGNRTRAANRRAKQDQTTEKLRAEVTA